MLRRGSFLRYLSLSTALLGLSLSSSCLAVDEFAPKEFRVGATVSRDGDLQVLVLDCLGGRLESIEMFGISADNQKGSTLWSAHSRAHGYMIHRRRLVRITPVAPPSGLTQTVDFKPEHRVKRLGLNVKTSRQAYGLTFYSGKFPHGLVDDGTSNAPISVADFSDASFCLDS